MSVTWPKGRALWLTLGAAAAIIIGMIAIFVARGPEQRPAVRADMIVGRGRLEPIGRVHLVSGPSEGGTIADLRVEEGQHVVRGQILAVLDRYDNAAAAVLAAERDLQLSRLQRRQVSAGAKQADISAQQALVGSRTAELQRARAQFDRADKLSTSGFVSADTLEERSLAVQRGQEALKEVRSSLRAMTETRPIDQDVAQAQIGVTEARLAGARATLERALIRAPIDGTVLAIFARAGGTLGAQGLMSLGDLRQMIAIGEFDEQIAMQIHAGQRVLVTLRGGRPYRGRIMRVLNDVNRNSRSTSDVLAGRDARIAEAEIRFDPGQRVPKLVGAEAVVRVVR